MAPKKKKKTSLKCVIHFPECHESQTVEIDDVRYDRLKKIAERRQSQPSGSSLRYDKICQQIPSTWESDIGYHR